MTFFRASLLSLFLLAGCGETVLPGQGAYIPPEQPGGRVCLLECRKGLGRCFEGCSLDKRACFVGMQKQAIKDYNQYARTQFMSRQALDLRPTDFERPETCENISCRTDCEKTYNACYEKCGGQIEGDPRPDLPPL